MLFLKGIEPCVKYTERLNLCQTFYVILIYMQIFYIWVLFLESLINFYQCFLCIRVSQEFLVYIKIFGHFIHTVDLIMTLIKRTSKRRRCF